MLKEMKQYHFERDDFCNVFNEVFSMEEYDKLLDLLTLGYIGSVNVHLNINGHKVDINTHNAGLPYLSRIFAKLITGNYED